MQLAGAHYSVRDAQFGDPGVNFVPLAVLSEPLEKAGIPTILISNLCSVAEAEGPNRILRSPGRFHHPLGDPPLPLAEERRWRLWFTRPVLATLQQTVTGPTVFGLFALTHLDGALREGDR